MSETAKFEIDLIGGSVNGANVTLNDALNKMDGIMQCAVEDFDLNSPPGSPVDGQAWKIGSSPTGAWSSNADQLAIRASGWRFVPITDGFILWDKDAEVFRYCEDASTDTWRSFSFNETFIAGLTDSTGGTPGASLGAVGDTSSSNQAAAINNNFASLAAKQNAILALLIAVGAMAAS